MVALKYSLSIIGVKACVCKIVSYRRRITAHYLAAVTELAVGVVTPAPDTTVSLHCNHKVLTCFNL